VRIARDRIRQRSIEVCAALHCALGRRAAVPSPTNATVITREAMYANAPEPTSYDGDRADRTAQQRQGRQRRGGGERRRERRREGAAHRSSPAILGNLYPAPPRQHPRTLPLPPLICDVQAGGAIVGCHIYWLLMVQATHQQHTVSNQTSQMSCRSLRKQTNHTRTSE